MRTILSVHRSIEYFILKTNVLCTVIGIDGLLCISIWPGYVRSYKLLIFSGTVD